MIQTNPTLEQLGLIVQFESDMKAENAMGPDTKFSRSKARQQIEKIGKPLLPLMFEHLKQNHVGKTIRTMKTDLFIGWTKLIPKVTGQFAYIGVAYIDQNMDEWIKLCERELAEKV
jgi:hypothetical protein